MLAVLRYLKGYFLLRISGYSPERFMNLCRINGVVLWDIIPGEGCYECKILKKDRAEIEVFLQKTKVTAEIRKEYGLPFFLQKNKKRKLFFAGVVVALFFIYAMSFFIWSFTFVGNEKIRDDILLRFLNSRDVDYGTLKGKVDIPKIEEEIREYFDGISWVSLRISGTRLIVSVKENTTLNNVSDSGEEVGDDLICGTKGTIVHMVTRKGVPVVKVGDSVDIGTVLVEGRVPIYDNDGNIVSYDLVDADADVTIRTEYPIHRNISRYYKHKNYTGNEYSLPYVRFGRHYFCIKYQKNTYNLYDVVEKESTNPIFAEFSIPVFWGVRRYCEYVEIEDLYNDEEASILLKRFLDETMKELNEKGVQIIENNVKIETDSQELKLTGSLLIDVMQKDN